MNDRCFECRELEGKILVNGELLCSLCANINLRVDKNVDKKIYRMKNTKKESLRKHRDTYYD